MRNQSANPQTGNGTTSARTRDPPRAEKGRARGWSRVLASSSYRTMKTLAVEDLVVQHINSRSCCGGGAACPSSCPSLAASARASHAALSSGSRLTEHVPEGYAQSARHAPTHACLPVLLAGWLHGTRETHAPQTRVTFWIRVRPAYRMHRMHTHVL